MAYQQYSSIQYHQSGSNDSGYGSNYHPPQAQSYQSFCTPQQHARGYCPKSPNYNTHASDYIAQPTNSTSDYIAPPAQPNRDSQSAFRSRRYQRSKSGSIGPPAESIRYSRYSPRRHVSRSTTLDYITRPLESKQDYITPIYNNPAPSYRTPPQPSHQNPRPRSAYGSIHEPESPLRPRAIDKQASNTLKDAGLANPYDFMRAYSIKTWESSAYEHVNEVLDGMRSINAQTQDEGIYGSDVEDYTEDEGERHDWIPRYQLIHDDESQDGSDIEFRRCQGEDRKQRRADEEGDAYVSGSDILPSRGSRYPDHASTQVSSPPLRARSSDYMEASDIEDVTSDGSESGSNHLFDRESDREKWIGSDVCSVKGCSVEGDGEEEWLGSDVCSVEACGEDGDCEDGEDGSEEYDDE